MKSVASAIFCPDAPVAIDRVLTDDDVVSLEQPDVLVSRVFAKTVGE
jgi:hypothetical protein